MNRIATWLVAIATSSIGIAAHPQKAPKSSPREIRSSKGTVNVLLAQGSTLVVATDSRLSDNGKPLSDQNPKIFQLDTKTVATIAGLYNESGGTGSNTFDFAIPSLMRSFGEFLASPDGNGVATLEAKATLLEMGLNKGLTTHLIALRQKNETLDSNKISPIQITIAGYDSDNSLKIAQFVMHAVVSGNLISAISWPKEIYDPADCEKKSRLIRGAGDAIIAVWDVGKAPTCVFAGISSAPEQALKASTAEPKGSLLGAFRDYEDKPAPTMYFRRLSLELVAKATAAEILNGRGSVGGTPNLAVLEGGKVSEFSVFSSHESPGESQGLLATATLQMVEDCGESMNPAVTFPRYSRIEIRATHCKFKIDGLVIHNSVFKNSVVRYDGIYPESTIFAHDNAVVNTSLDLGQAVDLGSAVTHDIVCSFGWKSVSSGTRLLSAHDLCQR